MEKGKRLWLVLGILLCLPAFLPGQVLQIEVDSTLYKQLTNIYQQSVSDGKVRIDSFFVDTKKKTVDLYADLILSYMPMTEEKVGRIEMCVRDYLPESYKKYEINVFSDGQNIRDLVPNFYRTTYKIDKTRIFTNREKDPPLKRNLSAPVESYASGLSNRHIALWQSHGYYYEQKLARWEWQRARIFQTVEDLYTQSYVLPYLVPMLENAGATVLLPRERDTQQDEIIVDKEKSSGKSVYRETVGKEPWAKGDSAGFAHWKEVYLDGENPFRAGSYQQTKTISKGKESLCEWIPDIPEKGMYGVYVSYRTEKNSTEDALYSVYHSGGRTDFKINQTMGGSTWIYLGEFMFDKGINPNAKVTLSNQSEKSGRVITADAVKIGGGMGNIARLPKNPKNLAIHYRPEISGYPRYTEGARYWLQWAGMPDSVYNRSNSENDYTDDYTSRAYWVNYISGGSPVAPEQEGLHIPIDMAMAFHTDAGTTYNDSTIGTLGIYMTHFNEEKFANGVSRWASRDLTDLIMTEIVSDIRREYEPEWTRRYLWNRSYAEARVPNVPTMLLELLSHQNFADMRYGLDPRFRFTVSRSIYKGILKYLSNQHKTEYVVQPLPVQSFSAVFSGENQVELRWQPTIDVAEPSARPNRYILYTRIGEGGFDNGRIIEGPGIRIDIQKDRIYGFKITAVNEGGESFPSEILSVCRRSNEKGSVLIVNGFDRLSAPCSFSSKDSLGGFLDFIDQGVEYKKQYNYIGRQNEFRRQIPWMDDDASGFGNSYANYETTVLAGNSFDYPLLHGLSVQKAGYSFASSSVKAVSEGQVRLEEYPLVDLILGKQKQTKIGRGVFPAEFKTFPKELQNKLSAYCQQGGNIFASGSYIASDLWDTAEADEEDRRFAEDILKYKWRVGRATLTGWVKSVASPFPTLSMESFMFYQQLNSLSYAVQSPDAIEPAGEDAYTIFRYSENNLSAGVVFDGSYRTCILGFPFETIENDSQRDSLMKRILNFMFNNQ